MFSFYLIALFILLVWIKPTRKFALAMLPWLIFGCCYDWMRLYPNYRANPIDVEGLYEAEKALFGIGTGAAREIPGEFFAQHHCAAADLLTGFFYLCWVPVPIAFSLYLYFKGNREGYLHFAYAFLFVNILGFIGYYIHPAAPPWYAMTYGMEPILHTPGNVAGLGRFDDLVGLPIFHSIYGQNANVFAAVPSLHAAYLLVTAFYSWHTHQRPWLTTVFALICAGIWFTAVYSGHHYIIDVLLGIATAILGLLLLERLIYPWSQMQSWLRRYAEHI